MLYDLYEAEVQVRSRLGKEGVFLVEGAISEISIFTLHFLKLLLEI